MSAINTTLPAGFPNLDSAAIQSPLLGNGGSSPSAATDAVTLGPAGFGAASPFDAGGIYGGSSSGSTGLGAFGTIMNGFMNVLATALSSLGNLFGAAGSSGTGSAASPSLGEQSYASATASSVGDPHDAFAGTTEQGSSVSHAWDDMRSHPDLLNSDSFGDGYRVSTTVAPAGANGKTYDATATVSANGGATTVTMNADGSYVVMENGRSVALSPDRATSLGGSESVTLGSDGSLTVGERNAAGGSLSTVLSSNGDGGVDVRAHAANADLGGYLVRRNDVETGPIPFGPSLSAGTGANLGTNPIAPFGTFTTQYGSGASSFEDVSRLLAQDGSAV